MRTLLYCHHSIGLGHLMRTLRLATAFSNDGPVTLISGGEIPPQLNLPDGIKVHCLPPLSMNLEGKLYDPHGQDSSTDILKTRADIVADVATRVAADAVIIEMYPFGRKKFAAEVSALIRNARTRARSMVICSVRDILVTTRKDQARFERRAVDTLNREFDALLVHADPEFIGLNASLSNYEDISIPIHYTGFIAPLDICPLERRDSRVVVSAGGGRVGRQIIDTAARAFPRIKSELGLDMTIVSGPFSDHTRSQCVTSEPGLTVVSFVDEFARLLSHSSLSISQCGYNTAADVLAAQTAAVFIPFETQQENEQLQRSERLAEIGRGVMLRESELSIDTFVRAAKNAFIQPRCGSVDIGGVHRTTRLVGQLVAHG